MSLTAIVAAIEAAGQAQVQQIQNAAEAQAQQILAAAEPQAAAQHAAMRRAALAPVAGERARQLHHARLQALQVVSAARDQLVAVVLTETQQRLAALRASADYAAMLQGLVAEALSALGAAQTAPTLEADPRDAALLSAILQQLGQPLDITLTLHTWGGVVAHSGDGRVVVINTLEARLERATPFLRQTLAALFEQNLYETQARWEFAAVP